jgi:methylated-DNA-[protein]-cysteine S-methyltransferase
VTAIASVETPLGAITVEATGDGLCGVRLHSRGSRRAGGARMARWIAPPLCAGEAEHLRRAVEALQQYFDGRAPPAPQLDVGGSAFDRRVWAALLEIPFGETVTYGALAARLGAPGAARAVGSANGRNPVAILVPCHRVVAAGGRLGGYAGGLEVKRWLLAHEGRRGGARASAAQG